MSVIVKKLKKVFDKPSLIRYYYIHERKETQCC